MNEIASLPPSTHVILAGLLGLLVGSFLNVVIYRYPKLLQYQFSSQSFEWLNNEKYPEDAPAGLVLPASRCPHCQTPIKAWQNIPVISFVLLGGKCTRCKEKISLRYPFVEILTAALTALVMLHFGWSLQALFGIILTWLLITLSFIDIDYNMFNWR